MEVQSLLSGFLRHESVSAEIAVHSTELVHFRKRISVPGMELIFQMSVGLHKGWKKIKLLDLVFINTPSFETADPK